MKLAKVAPEPIGWELYDQTPTSLSNSPIPCPGHSGDAPNGAPNGDPKFTAQTAIEFNVTSRERNEVRISVGGVPKYMLRRRGQRQHGWFLETAGGTILARLRVSRCFSRMTFVEGPCGSEICVRQSLLLGNAVMEWQNPWDRRETLRWRRIDRSLISVIDGVVTLVPTAQMTSVPRNRRVLSIEDSLNFGVLWQAGRGDTDPNFEPLLICTALVAHWRWAREVRVSERIARHFRQPFVQWVGENLDFGPNMIPLNQLIARHPAIQSFRRHSRHIGI